MGGEQEGVLTKAQYICFYRVLNTSHRSFQRSDWQLVLKMYYAIQLTSLFVCLRLQLF